MPFQLGWVRPAAATVLHLLRALAAGRSLSDERLQHALTPFAQPLASPAIEPELWRAAVGHTATWHRQALAADATRLAPPSPGSETIASDQPPFWQCPNDLQPRWLRELMPDALRVTAEAKPGLIDELAHRQRPLHEQWLARGPGFVRQLERNWLAEPLPKANLDVICLLPVQGGHGESHPEDAAVSWEAVLTNVDERLPELVRLAYLITDTQLASHQGFVTALPRQLVALAVTLRLADELEWIAISPTTVELALQSFNLTGFAETKTLADDLHRMLQAPDLASHLFVERPN